MGWSGVVGWDGVEWIGWGEVRWKGGVGWMG